MDDLAGRLANRIQLTKSIVRLHRFGRGLSRSERKSEYKSAHARGKRIAAALFEGLQGQKKD